MRFGWVAGVGALVLIASLALGRLATAQTPTPTSGPTGTPSPAPSPSPTPYPVGSSTITIRFVTDGKPLEIATSAPLVLADGVFCPFPVIEPELRFSYALVWPAFAPNPGIPNGCTKGPPTSLRFEFGALFTELVWTGTDVTVDIEVPAATQTATATPGELPDTGMGSSGAGASYWQLLAVGVLVAGGAGALIFLGLSLKHRPVER
jgi:hypothetical protein